MGHIPVYKSGSGEFNLKDMVTVVKSIGPVTLFTQSVQEDRAF